MIYMYIFSILININKYIYNLDRNLCFKEYLEFD